MGERLNGIQEVDGSIPFSSTNDHKDFGPKRNPPRPRAHTSTDFYGSVDALKTAYWKHLFGLPVVWNDPTPCEMIASAFPFEPASV